MFKFTKYFLNTGGFYGKGFIWKIMDKGLNDKIKESDLKVIRSINKSELSSVLSISYQKFIYIKHY